MIERKITITYTEYASKNELSTDDQSLIEKAREAAEKAYAPYSNFKVGAAIMLESGNVITGNNQENAAYPSGLCAERVALFAANANFPDSAIISLAITALKNNKLVHEPIKPCGSCRQSLLESEVRFKKPIRIILDSDEKIIEIIGIANLLPLSFDVKSLLSKY